MKGVSAVIAVVLILMITVALSAMAYVWFTDVFKNISESAGEAATSAASQIGSGFSIVSASGSTTNGVEDNDALIQITNTGTTILQRENFNILIITGTGDEGIPVDVATTETGDLRSGDTVGHIISKSGETGYFNGDWCGKAVSVNYGDLPQVTTMACQAITTSP